MLGKMSVENSLSLDIFHAMILRAIYRPEKVLFGAILQVNLVCKRVKNTFACLCFICEMKNYETEKGKVMKI